MVAQVHFTRTRIHGQWRSRQKIVRAVHAALGWGLLVLLDCHGIQLLDVLQCDFFKADRAAKGILSSALPS